MPLSRQSVLIFFSPFCSTWAKPIYFIAGNLTNDLNQKHISHRILRLYFVAGNATKKKPAVFHFRHRISVFFSFHELCVFIPVSLFWIFFRKFSILIRLNGSASLLWIISFIFASEQKPVLPLTYSFLLWRHLYLIFETVGDFKQIEIVFSGTGVKMKIDIVRTYTGIALWQAPSVAFARGFVA